MIDVADIRSRYQQAAGFLDQRGRRLFAANEAVAQGHGGVSAASVATGIARSTINRGIKDLRAGGNDIAANHGWVSVGVAADTAAFVVESIRRWWYRLGKAGYPDAKRLVVTADCGGSNGVRVRLWKRELQRFANETGLAVNVTHLPPGTSKWNKIEHRLFAFITKNWRAKPLVSHQVIAQLIAATNTETELKVCCDIDGNLYPKGIKVTDQEMATINISRDNFHGEWNYTISSNQQPP